MVLLSSPFWVAWLAVILNQQGGLSGAEGSEEEELCVCLFVVLHMVTFCPFLPCCFTHSHLRCFLYFALDFHFAKCLILLLVFFLHIFCILPWQEEGGRVFLCV